MGNLDTTYQQLYGDDVFASGISRKVKERILDQANRLHEQMDMDRDGLYRVLMEETERGCNHGGLRVLCATIDCDGQSRVDFEESTGMTKGSVATYTRRLEDLGILYSVRDHARAPKVYFLTPDWQEQIERLRPTLKTYKLHAQRAERYYAQSIEQRIAYGKTVESQSERLIEVMVDLHECTPEEAQASVSEFVSELEKFKQRGQMQPRHRNDGPTIEEERRSKRLDWAFKRTSDLAAMLEAGEPMAPEMIAEFRTLAGKIDVDITQYADQMQAAVARYQQGRQVEMDLYGGYEHLAEYALEAA